MKHKTCTKCNRNYPTTSKYFPPCRHTKDKLQSWCRKCYRKWGKERSQTGEGKKRHCKNQVLYRKRHPKRVKEQQKQYNQTINGHLRHIFGYIKYRCNNPIKQNICYKNVKNKFKSVAEFVDYVVNDLQIDPRGLTIDRINNNGHYEPGNIRFVTQAENNRNKKKDAHTKSK